MENYESYWSGIIFFNYILTINIVYFTITVYIIIALFLLFLLCSIHDRKLSVLGLCTVLQCPLRPGALQNNAGHILPMILHQLELLLAAYKSKIIMIIITSCQTWANNNI